ncbi:MAG: PilC/PilY family type IV pilus protein, partial [Gammaproteobacteria bacterium]|nr:PilC/PilY family type IV pilus protein [Gammaproteobacteria bacterium]
MKRILSIKRTISAGPMASLLGLINLPIASFGVSRHLQRLGVCLIGALLAALPITSSAGPLSLVDTPLFLANQVNPNIILAIDDSGSMDFEVLLPTNDGALWWDTGSESFADGSGNLHFKEEKKFVYLFPNGQSSTYNGRRVYGDGSSSHFAIPPVKAYAYARSPDFNKAYYNPDVEYTPWVSFGSITFGNIDWKKAPWDPYYSGAGTVDLRQTIDEDNSNWTFKYWKGMVEEDGDIADDEDDMQIEYFPATYYRIAGTPDNSSYTGTVKLEGLDPKGNLLEKYEIKPANYGGQAYNNAMQNFANWFTYYRRRHLAMRAGMGSAFQGLTDMYTGIFTINNRINVTMWDMASQSNTFYDTLYTSVGRGGTPNRQALDWAGQQYERNGDGAPIIEACQQNYTIQFTDGYSTLDTSSGVGNADSVAGPYSGTAPYTDSYSNTLADISMHYYKKNVRPDLAAGKVATNPLDSNPDPHMVTFTVGLGVTGTIFGVTHNTVADAYASPPVWPDPNTARDPKQIDDLYHAAVNGRGELLNAKTPKELADVMKNQLQNIIARTASRASVALNSGSLDANSRLYQARFKSGAWTGQLLAFGLNETTGAVNATEDWDAGALLTTRVVGSGWGTNRQVITYNGTQSVPFRWASLSAAMQGELNKDGQGAPDTVGFEQGDKRLEYLRGSAEHESTGNNYRSRTVKLGDVVNSSPVFMADPPFNYPDGLESQAYSTFASNNASRTPMVYIGANDGMLHGFNANTGEELIAYVPNRVFPNLTRLTTPNYNHRFFVDGSPTVGDAFWGSAWRTVLAGGLRQGGQGIYALDVTNPGNFGEANASSLALWEFTDADDKDLGYTYARPAIVRMNNGKWAAVFGNGYNNTEADGDASTTGNAVLYIAFIEDGLDGNWSGADFVKLDTGEGTADDPTGSGRPNGLTTAAPVDVDGDRIIDYIYAGDLFGNMWKFDVTSSNKASWDVAYGGNPLFVATDGSVPQPITTPPEVGLHPESASGKPGYMIYFGTGKYIESGDNTTTGTQTQSYYGIWDPDAASAPSYSRSSNLLEQQILDEITSKGAEVRITTDNQISWATDPLSPGVGEHIGWYMDLVNTASGNTDPKGERQTTTPVLRNGRIIFTTLIPSDAPCEVSGDGWLMELDFADGSRLGDPPFDLDDDGVFDFVDDGNGNMVSPGGIKSTGGAPSAPGILDRGDGQEYKYLSGTDQGAIQV